MTSLTDFASYQDAQANFSREKLWSLFDGDQNKLNIANECIDRHVGSGLTVTIVSKSAPDIVLTAAEIALWSNRFANFLVARGVVAGDRVGMMLDPSLPFYVCLFGAMKAGAVAVPLYTLFGRDGLRLRVGDCQPVILIVAPDKQDISTGLGNTEVIVADTAFMTLLASHGDSFEPNTRSDDMAMFQYTSGTTRELPDAVRHRHRAVVTVMIAALYGTGLRPGDRFCCPSSPAWGHGLWHGTIAPLALGISIWAWAGQFDAKRLLASFEQHRITNLSAAATHYRLMKNSGSAGDYSYAFDKLTYTGEPTDTATEEFIVETFGKRACSMYGTTEVGVILVNYPGADDIAIKPRSLGKAVPGLDVAVHDPSGRNTAPLQIGEIVVKRAGEWVRTKDLGWTDDEGYFFHGGRADDVIISAGWTMSAREIEDTLLKHGAIAEAAVIGVPDQLRGQIVKAYLVLRQAATDGLVEELQLFTRTRLAQHEYPRLIEFVDELPKSTSGKVNRAALRKKVAEASGVG